MRFDALLECLVHLLEPARGGFEDGAGRRDRDPAIGGFRFVFPRRDDIEDKTAEPGRLILNFHVDDARGTAARLNQMGVSWLQELEERPSGLFGTLIDPDGNYLQIIECTEPYT